MKKVLTIALVLTACCAVNVFGQAKHWQFAKVFPDTNFAPPSGVHGLAVDPDGKIWVTPFGITDSIVDATTATKRGVRQVFVFNPNGTQAAFSGFKTVTIGATTDTLYNNSRGAKTAADGNIVFASLTVYYKINYHTGAGIAKVVPTVGASLTAPAFTSANEMFSGQVAEGQDIKIFDGSFASLGTAVVGAPGFSRTLEVSKDGNNIYWPGYTTHNIRVYHSDNGTLGPYVQTDSFAIGCQVESMVWHPKNGYLYASSGNADTVDYTPAIAPPWRTETWYGFDVVTKTPKDSLTWNRSAYPYPYNDITLVPRPRAIAFSPGGDTAYVAGFQFAKASIQMFVNVLTSVETVDNQIPSGYALTQNYPNPFNPSTEIRFTVARSGYTTLKVYDILGKEVATLVNENLAPGTFKVSMDGKNLSSGSYIYTLTSGDSRISKKMMLLK